MSHILHKSQISDIPPRRNTRGKFVWGAAANGKIWSRYSESKKFIRCLWKMICDNYFSKIMTNRFKMPNPSKATGGKNGGEQRPVPSKWAWKQELMYDGFCVCENKQKEFGRVK